VYLVLLIHQMLANLHVLHLDSLLLVQLVHHVKTQLLHVNQVALLKVSTQQLQVVKDVHWELLLVHQLL